MNMIDALFEEESRKFSGKPHALIQWKGTTVCMDFHCECGKTPHVDAGFAYYVQCPHCDAIYEIGSHVSILKTDSIPRMFVIADPDVE